MVEYGVPHATFRVIGTVTDSDGEPVPGIRIATQVQTPEYIDPAIRKDTLYTDENGTYVREYMIYHDTENIPDSVTVTAEDIDRKANGGEFRPVKGQKAEVVKASEGRRRWDEGTWEARADFKLRRK